jgi:hypothetical protein
VTAEKSGSHPGVGNDRTGAQVQHNCRHMTCSSHAGLRHNGRQSVPKQRHMWHISAKLILNCTRSMWKNERQAGETTSN